MIRKDQLNKFRDIPTPFYFYDMEVLKKSLDTVKHESDKSGIKVHYAVKANANPVILKTIASYGFGADCVSYNEIRAAIEAGFDPSGIVFAGVGKSDHEINSAISDGIYCFNCESIPEIEVINEFAGKQGKNVNIALRINPNVEAHTHKYITTGVEESKFGIHRHDLGKVVDCLAGMSNLTLIGIHFHIGSQITKMPVFQSLCNHVNEFRQWFADRNIDLNVINLGGGLGVDYENPETEPQYEAYFELLRQFIDLNPGQELHLEPGRAIVAQCGSLISKVLYVKDGVNTKFAIIDAGMTDLIRPALYQAHHKIENISSSGPEETYDVVGPICESSDTFARGISLPATTRGDLLAIRSAGAYGEVMASRYNLRDIPKSYFSDKI